MTSLAARVAALPPERFESARWFGSKGEGVRLELVERFDFAPDRALLVCAAGDEHYCLPVVVSTLCEMEPEDSAWCDLASACGVTVGHTSRALGADQSHTSLVLDERVMLKCYRLLAASPGPEVDRVRYLAGHGFRYVPAVDGALSFAGFDVVLCQAYVPDALDAWYQSKLDIADGVVGSWVFELGTVTAEMHRLFRNRDGRPATADEAADWEIAARAQIKAAGEPVVFARAELGRQAAVLGAAQGALVSTGHGDFHVGQVLVRADRVVGLVDFEGEPAASLARRHQLGSPLRDVAGMLGSLDRVARFTCWKSETSDGDANQWSAQARSAFLGAYRAVHDVDATLLRAFEYEKAVYEHVYAATYLPWWSEIANRSLHALLDES